MDSALAGTVATAHENAPGGDLGTDVADTFVDETAPDATLVDETAPDADHGTTTDDRIGTHLSSREDTGHGPQRVVATTG